ncbi:hypothetical protein D3C75_792930 [compost metagenome]
MEEKDSHGGTKTEVGQNQAGRRIHHTQPADDLHQRDHNGLERNDHRRYESHIENTVVSAVVADHFVSAHGAEKGQQNITGYRDHKRVQESVREISSFPGFRVVVPLEHGGQRSGVRQNFAVAFDRIGQQEIKRYQKYQSQQNHQQLDQQQRYTGFLGGSLHYSSTSLFLVALT